MDIKEFTSYSNEGSTCQENGISNKDIAVLAIGTGAITATKKASMNEVLQKQVSRSEERRVGQECRSR